MIEDEDFEKEIERIIEEKKESSVTLPSRIEEKNEKIDEKENIDTRKGRKVNIFSIFGVIIIVSIIVSAYAGYYYSGEMKDSEISGLTSEYNSEKEIMKLQIESLENQKENLKEEIEESETNRIKYEKLMFKGTRKNVQGDYLYGYAAADFESASMYYDISYLEDAKIFYDSADTTYASSNNFYKEAEAYFEDAIEYAPNDDMKELAMLSKNESMYAALVTSALHQNCEYMSSACDAYNNGNYPIGDEQLDIANTFIDEHDSLIPSYENATTAINSLLDTL